MKNLILRTCTGIIFLAAVISSFLLYDKVPVFFYLLFLFFTVVGTFELTRMAENIGIKSNMPIALLMSAFVFSWPSFCYFGPLFLYISLCIIPLLFVILLFIELFKNEGKQLTNVSVTCLPMLWVAVPFAMVEIMLSNGEIPLVLSIFIIIWLSDTLAYCSGRLFGKHKLFERISPKKTMEGFIISMVLTAAIALSFHWIPFFNVNGFTRPWHWCCLALLVILSGTFGDLAESMFKRNCEVKDSGKILPGHGGILDRFDSSFFAIPMAFAFWMLLQLLSIY